MQPCQNCSSEPVGTVLIALVAIIGVAAMWQYWPGKSWSVRLPLLLGGAAVIGAGMVAYRLAGSSRNEAPACPCMTAERRAAPPVFATTDSPSPPAPVARDPLPSRNSAEPAAASTAPDSTPAVVTGQSEATASPSLSPQVVVYYFHRKMRCHSCLQIEEWAKQIVETHFNTQLAAGVVEWRPVNVEDPGNEHFVKDYKLDSQSLVMVRVEDGKPGSWKNLEKVWDLLGDYAKFTKYVQDELSGSLDQASTAPHP